MKWLAIINPSADHHSTGDLQALDKQLRNRVGAQCSWTEYENHGRELVRRGQYDGYIAVGGDGTISEVVNGMANNAGACLGIVPAGTGNGLARDLHLRDEASALRALERPRFACLDSILMRFRQHHIWQQRHVICTAAIGYVVGATQIAYRNLKRAGAISHTLGAIAQSFYQKAFSARLRLDNDSWLDLPLTTLAIKNNQHIGSFRIFPEARVDDGLLDVLYGRLSTYHQLEEDLHILFQTYLFCHSTHRQARCVEVQLCQPSSLMVDGAIYAGVDALHCQIEPGRVSCCTA